MMNCGKAEGDKQGWGARGGGMKRGEGGGLDRSVCVCVCVCVCVKALRRIGEMKKRERKAKSAEGKK